MPNALKRQQGLLFVAPAMALFAVFVLYPLVYNFQASFLSWDGINVGHSVGLGNYRELILDDPVFRRILKNSVLWILLTIFPQMGIGFLLALMVSQRLRGTNAYRAIFYLPAIVSPIVVGTIWTKIYDPAIGLFGAIYASTGIGFFNQSLPGDATWSIYACIFVNVWQWTGFSMLMYIAGLQGIDEDVLDAASIDGTGPFQRIRYVIWPLLRGVHTSLILLGIIGSLKTFELIFVLTNGGPDHTSEMLPSYTYLQAFENQRVGYAATISVVLVVISIGASMLFVRLFGMGSIGSGERTL